MINLGAPQAYRQRYVAFRVDESISKGDLINVISRIANEEDFSPSPWVIIFAPDVGEGIVRCGHLQLDGFKEKLLNFEEFDLEILGVSGTIKKTRQKFLSSENFR